MSKKNYAVVGMWSGGLYVCEYEPANGSLRPLGLYGEKELNCGFQIWDSKRQLIYATDEVRSRGTLGGGGYATAWKLDGTTGALECVSRVNTLAENPSWICFDSSGEYALITHFCAQFDGYTKIVRGPDGSWSSCGKVSDVALVLMRMKPDGSFGDVVDVAIHRGSGKPGHGATSHLHSVTCDPSGELFAVCDMGTDQIYTYHLNRTAGKLHYIDTFQAEYGTEPRYQVFDEKKPYLYTNNEGIPEVYSFRYDVLSGKLERISVCRTLAEDVKPTDKPFAPADLILSPDGTRLYSAIRIANRIGVVAVGNDGKLTYQQSIDAGGKKPKGLALSPDGTYLFSANGDSGNITRFAVRPDGSLAADGVAAELGGSPGNIVFVTI